MSDLTVTNSSPNGTSQTTLWGRVTLKQVALGTVLAVLLLLVLALVVALRYVLLLLFLSIVVATALAPVAERLRRLGLPQGLSVLIAFGLSLVLVAGVLAALVPFFAAQIAQLVVDLPTRYLSVRDTIATSRSTFVRGLAAQMPPNLFQNISGEQGIAVGTTVAALLPSVGQGLLFGALVLFLSYYWLYYRSLAVQAVALLVPLARRAEVTELWNQIEAKIGAFVRGLALLGLVITVLSGIAYTVIGLPYGLTIAIIAGILEAIPYVGPFVTMALVGIVGLSVSPVMAAEALVIAACMQLIEGSVIVPRVMDRAVGVRPVVTLLALAILADLFGLLGALLAVPIAAVVQVLLDRFVLSATMSQQPDIGGRDKLALLRYQTQDLASDLRQQVRSKTEEVNEDVDAAEEELEALLLDLDGLLANAQEQIS